MYQDEYGTCPYNNEHRIMLFRMPSHIIKCRKHYNGPPLDQCIYNATHLVPFGTMESHLESCQEHHRFHNTKYIKMAERSRRSNEAGD